MIGRVVDQIFRSSTAAPGEPARSSDSVFDRMRGFTPEPRDFTSHFHQSLANVPDFPEQATFVILFHSDSSSDLQVLVVPQRSDHGSLRESLFLLSILEFILDKSMVALRFSGEIAQRVVRV
jgi:hypothetical protein